MAEPNRPLRLGVVGLGAVALRVLDHLALDDVASAVEVAHVCARTPGRSEAVARRHGIPRWSESLDAMLRDGELDAVTIATPIGLHHAQTVECLRAGLHVHVNKTMTTSVSEATEVIELAARQGLHVVPSPGEMLYPHNQQVRRLIDAGAIGRVCWAACGAAFGDYHLNEPERLTEGVDPTWYYLEPGGGPLWDMTVYALHGLTGILGSATAVTAMSTTILPERIVRGKRVSVEIDDNTLLLLEMQCGALAFAYGTAAGVLGDDQGWDPSGRYYGTSGRIVGRSLNAESFDYPGAAAAQALPDGDKALLPHVKAGHASLLEQHVFEDIMQLVDLARDGTPTVVTPEHARHVIDIIAAGLRAARTGHRQELATTMSGLR